MNAPVFKPVSVERTAEITARALRLQIRVGNLQPGSRFPAERELAELMGVSRATLREAIRFLQGEGTLRVVGSGSARCNIVSEQQHTSEILRAQLNARLPELMEVFELRSAVECASAGLAAQRRTPEDLERMQQAIVALRDCTSINTFIHADTCFHEAIAKASGNSRFLEIVTDVRSLLYEATWVFETISALSKSVDDHVSIMKNIEAGNREAAEDAMRHHVEFARLEVLAMLKTEEKHHD